MFGYGNRMSDVSSDLDTLRSDLSRLAGTVSNMISSQSKSAGSDAQSSYGSLRDGLTSRASDWSDRGAAFASDARDRLVDVNSDLETRIERNPMAAVLIAAGIGLAIGLMSRSR